jgi:hypothetical protein
MTMNETTPGNRAKLKRTRGQITSPRMMTIRPMTNRREATCKKLLFASYEEGRALMRRLPQATSVVRKGTGRTKAFEESTTICMTCARRQTVVLSLPRQIRQCRAPTVAIRLDTKPSAWKFTSKLHKHAVVAPHRFRANLLVRKCC